MENKIIGEISKNSVEKLVFEIKEYKGKIFLDIRTYFLKDHKNWLPTKKGITVSPDNLNDFKELFEKSKKELEDES